MQEALQEQEKEREEKRKEQETKVDFMQQLFDFEQPFQYGEPSYANDVTS